MNYSNKKIALLIGALIIGQAITMQDIHGMESNASIPSNHSFLNNLRQAFDKNFWLTALPKVQKELCKDLSAWCRDTRPISKATAATIQLVSQSLPVTVPLLESYCEYNYLPSIISYPLLTWRWANHIQALTRRPAIQNLEVAHPTTPSITSEIFKQISNGAQDAGITSEAIQAGVAAVKTFVNPAETIKQGYEISKNAFGTVKNDAINAVKHEIRDDIRYALNIPPYQDVNFDTITNKLTDKFKDEIRDAKNDMKDEFNDNLRYALNIPANQAVNIDTITDKLTDKFKDEIAEAKDAIKGEIEYSYRRTLNIPADQPVNVETIAKKIVEDPVRKIFNIHAEEEVTADAVMYNIAKNTVYRFGIPTAVLVAATPIAITAGYFGCKYAYHRLTTEPEPPIFIESSEKSRWQNLKDFVSRNTDEIPELAYSEELEKTFDLITRSSINAFHEIQDGKKNIFYEPVLMYGPPGTGKTAKAKQMIKQIYQATDGQMQWRITNGSMLLNAGQNGINKMFDWLKKQPAACLFIDEADTLFPDRDELEKYPERLEIVNHLLSLIGERSNKFMIIMTTNRLGAFDDAMARRIDNLIHIPLPNEQGRNRVLELYRDNMLLNQQSSWMMKLAQKHCPQLFEKPTLKRKN